ncbi:Pyruvate decarboxylase [Purpureocillium lavendulum]|uniref:Pyruvate decarboxylase n=1 Tax=Purpureocillium lavendulum TaxID=1247861 RepID=A0AB34FNJ7_9HYPO|nr:Pyruvate decarboxylase [Purpureocillium lavendulum]
MTVPPECAFDGNTDLYGFGVRLGVYAQWIATLITTVLDPENEAAFRLLNLVVQSSIFLGLCTESKPGNHAVGSVITQFLLCGSLSSVTGDGISHFGHMSGILRTIFYTAFSAWGIWFWFVGVDVMENCGGQAVAFFGPSTVTGWVRSFGKALSIIGLIGCTAIAAFSVYAARRRFGSGFTNAFARRGKWRPQVELSLMFASMGLIALSITAIEYLIAQNNVGAVGPDRIDSVAQLIPLLAGGVACTLALWKVATDGLLVRRRCWLLFGWHL